MRSKLATLFGFGLMGIQGYAVRVEVEVSRGCQSFCLVGLPDTIVSESRERVRCAMNSSQHEFPDLRVTVNMAPADIRKEGPLFDLPIALALLTAQGVVKPAHWDSMGAVGELSLDGQVRGIRGAMPLAMACKEKGLTRLMLPAENAEEASLVEGMELWPVSSLTEAVACLKRQEPLAWERTEAVSDIDLDLPDLVDVVGHRIPRRALEVAACGGHNILFIGPPGSGKTMLAQRLPGILPPLSTAEALSVMQVQSAAGLLRNTQRAPLVRPFRAPHHSASPGGIVGGGSIPRPGEISLAHHGVLFFDELAEFPRTVLEVLREPLESHLVTLARAATTVTFPADFIFVACMNPCPCGNDSQGTCRCARVARQRYRSRISGPLLDRIDLIVEVSRESTPERGETSHSVRTRVVANRDIQLTRFAGTCTTQNARMSLRQVRQYCGLDTTASSALADAIQQTGLSARAVDRVLRVSRTLADMEGMARIEAPHILEAVNFRRGMLILTRVE